MKKIFFVVTGLFAIIVFTLIVVLHVRTTNNDALPIGPSNPLLHVMQETTERDVSEIDVAVDANATFIITDMTKRRTGRDPKTGELLQELPGSTYFEDRIDDVSGQQGSKIARFAQINTPAQGEYSIVLTGLRDGPYELSVRAFSRNGSAQPPLSRKGEIKPGFQVRFVLTFTPTPFQNSTLTEVSKDRGQPVQ